MPTEPIPGAEATPGRRRHLWCVLVGFELGAVSVTRSGIIASVGLLPCCPMSGRLPRETGNPVRRVSATVSTSLGGRKLSS